MNSRHTYSFTKALGTCIQTHWLVALLTVFMGFHAPAKAQTTTPKAQSVVAADDRSAIRVRYPAPEKLRNFQTDRAYRYDQDAPPPENPVARFFNWLYRRLMRFLSSDSYQNVWQYVILAVISGFVIYLLKKADVLLFLFPKKPQSGGLDYENLAENIHEIDFDTAVEEAVALQNLRLAVRLLYLQTLKRLSDSGLINYKSDKTNRQYVYELINTRAHAGFENLTRQFEFIWYGNFPIDEARFQQIRHQFSLFSQTVSQSNTVNPAGGPVTTNFAKTE